MDRFTKAIEKAFYVDPAGVQQDENGYTGDAISRLATFENIQEDLLAQQIKITAELAKLRQEGKEKTTKFRQLLANKIMNNNILILFKTYGL